MVVTEFVNDVINKYMLYGKGIYSVTQKEQVKLTNFELALAGIILRERLAELHKDEKIEEKFFEKLIRKIKGEDLKKKHYVGIIVQEECKYSVTIA